MFKRFLAICIAAMLALPLVARADDDKKLPEPAAPQHESVEGGRIDVSIGTSRASDYQIGDSIRVNLVFILTPNSLFKARQQVSPPVVPPLAVAAAQAADKGKIEELKVREMPMVELEGLKMGVVSDKPSDVVSLAPAEVHEYLRDDGTKMVVATAYVTTYVTTQKTQVGVSFAYTYAVTDLPDGQPNWKTANTVELPIGLTKAATDNQTLLIDGDLSEKLDLHVPVAGWLMLFSMLLAVPMLVSYAQIGYRALHRERLLTRNQKTWVLLDQIIASANGELTIDHYRKIFYCLREHFDVLGMDTTQTLESLDARPGLDSEAVAIVFNQETLFFDPEKAIEPEQHDRLMAAIAVLIPRE